MIVSGNDKLLSGMKQGTVSHSVVELRDVMLPSLIL